VGRKSSHGTNLRSAIAAPGANFHNGHDAGAHDDQD
jgi:hypothetical protein